MAPSTTFPLLHDTCIADGNGGDNDTVVLEADAHNSISHKTGKHASSPTYCNVVSIPPSLIYSRNKYRGCHSALLRSLSAAGVKFLRYAIVDAYNSMRCKVVPLSHAMKALRNHDRYVSSSLPSPMDHPVSIAEAVFAGLQIHVDHLVPSSNLTARNVLTLQPDFSSLRILPYAPATATIMCTGHNQYTRELSPLCTRGLLERVLQVAREDIGVEFSVGAELEFVLFSSGSKTNMSGKDVPQPVDCSKYADSQALNEQEDFINSLYDQLQKQDIDVELIQTECAPGQFEVVLAYSNNVLQVADDIVLAQETIRACAKQHGMKALFLPKTSMDEAGSGLHLHFSFQELAHSSTRARSKQSSKDDDGNAFSDPTQPHGISLQGGAFIEGIMTHLSSLLSFTIPTINSFRRMGPGNFTGHDASWSIEDKEVPIRVCMDSTSQKITNVEYKLLDATANIYLALAVLLSAGMEGMKSGKKLRPMASDGGGTGEPLPESLKESLDLLKKDHFLLSVLGPELSTAYIAVRESDARDGENSTLEEEIMLAFKRA